MSLPIRDKTAEELLKKDDSNVHVKDRTEYTKIAIREIETRLYRLKINPKIEDLIMIYDLVDAIASANRFSYQTMLAKKREIKENEGTYEGHYVQDD
jgi:predicted house-cleaning noncanonical NTP pyrophosphatase (MazG superfamily)